MPEKAGVVNPPRWQLFFTVRAQKDAKKLAAAGLKGKALKMLELLEQNPHAPYPPYEKLPGDLAGACSRRITIKHRLVYQVLDKTKQIKVLSLWTHYER